MKVSSDASDGFFTRLWSLICVGAALIIWGVMTRYSADVVTLPHLLSLYGLSSLLAGLCALLAFLFCRPSLSVALYWLGIGTSGSAVFSLVSWLHFQFQFGEPTTIGDEIMVLW